MAHVYITGHPAFQQERMKIQCIKAFRNVTNAGLKEAKDAIDSFWDSNTPTLVEVPEGATRNEFARQLEAEGFTVVGGVNTTMSFDNGVTMYDLLKTAAILALDKHNPGLANDILNIIQRHNL